MFYNLIIPIIIECKNKDLPNSSKFEAITEKFWVLYAWQIWYMHWLSNQFSVWNISGTLMSGARAKQDNELFTAYTASAHVFPEWYQLYYCMHNYLVHCSSYMYILYLSYCTYRCSPTGSYMICTYKCISAHKHNTCVCRSTTLMYICSVLYSQQNYLLQRTLKYMIWTGGLCGSVRAWCISHLN